MGCQVTRQPDVQWGRWQHANTTCPISLLSRENIDAGNEGKKWGAGPIARAFRRSIIPRLAQGGFPLSIKSITGSLAFVGESWDRCAVLWTCTLACA